VLEARVPEEFQRETTLHNLIHFFILKQPDIRYVALIPKGEHVTITAIGQIGISKAFLLAPRERALRSTSAPPACDTLPWVVHARAQRGAAPPCGPPGARAGAAQRCACRGWTRAAGWGRRSLAAGHVDREC
jgi:hypothetical protein